MPNANDDRRGAPAGTPSAELEALWRREIPMAAAMEIRVARHAAGELLLRAPLTPNANPHGTAFAGSLYAISALAGWGMLWLELRSRGREGHIVLAEGRIRYRKAVEGDLFCRCRFDAAAQAPHLETLERTGRASFTLACEVEAENRALVRFEGDYAVRVARP